MWPEPLPRCWTWKGSPGVIPALAFPRPVVVVVVDTEEQFDWSRGFERSQTGVSHMRAIGGFQSVCDERGVRPVYVVDHPIATQEESAAPLRAILARGGCEIGAHLHPWVSPPHDEEVNARNSYPGNLPRELEREKIARLTRAIETAFGVRPRTYKSGRYGSGPNTAAILEELGYAVDLSPCPPFDFRADGGPDWSRAPLGPWWVAGPGSLLAVPSTGAYVGWAGESAHALYRRANSGLWRRLHAGGVLARVGAVERLFLSPEGYTPRHLERLTRSLLSRGVRVFSLSLHSPSFEPGHTPYVRNETELHSLLGACRSYLDYFLGELGGVNLTALELRRHVETHSRTSAA